jgi:hypothetical protein
MTTITHPNKSLAGQYAVTRRAKSGICRTSFYKSLADALKAKGRAGTIAQIEAK